jgi:hypothetical protein
MPHDGTIPDAAAADDHFIDSTMDPPPGRAHGLSRPSAARRQKVLDRQLLGLLHNRQLVEHLGPEGFPSR